MNEVASDAAVKPALSYPCGDPPAPGHVREVAPDVLWIRMPMPFRLSHINLWAIKDGDGWMIVDTGLQTDDTANAWRSLFTTPGPLQNVRLSRVLVTHMHPDHVGMAGWLTRKFDCKLWMTRLEYLNCRVLQADTGREAPKDGERFYSGAGWDADAIEGYRARFGDFGRMIHKLPDSYRRIQDGEELRIGNHVWHVVVGSGHSPEHACLYCPELKVLISGDQVLPRISSNVSVFPTEPDADPLGEWLLSIEQLKQTIPDDVLVLPAHQEPFRGLHARLDALAMEHRLSLGELREYLRTPRRTVDVFETLFSRAIGPRELMLATGESVAHLNYLVHRGEVARREGPDGTTWYQSM